MRTRNSDVIWRHSADGVNRKRDMFAQGSAEAYAQGWKDALTKE